MKELYNILISMKTFLSLSIIYATVMGLATFIENDYGTTTARTLIYNAFWFELIMILLAINLIGNIIRYKMYERQKWAIFIFHIAFLLILAGAGITRYISFEGMMPIKEGETTDRFLGYQVFLEINVDDGISQISPPFRKKLALSNINFPFLTDNHYQNAIDFKGKKIDFKILDYIPNAQDSIVPDPQGNKYLKMVVSTPNGRKELFLSDGKIVDILGKRFAFNSIDKQSINIFEKNDSLYFKSPVAGTYMRMSDQKTFEIVKDSVMPFQLASLYQLDNLNFVVPQKAFNGKIKYFAGDKDSAQEDMILLQLSSGNQEKTVALYGGQYSENSPKIFQLNDLNFRIKFGSIYRKLPFQIQLRDFQLEKYPGSEMPKSYASEVSVIDKKNSFNFRIFMNHVLDYKGYRFYQSSYTITPEFEQSQLSVNHDFWGTWVTYLGYALLYFGLIAILFIKKGRFYILRQKLSKLQAKRKAIILLLSLLGSTNIFAQNNTMPIDSIILKTIAPADKAEQFGKLVIQDYGGRMKPVNTYSSELLRKLTKHNTYTLTNGQKITADQVLTGLISFPEGWWSVPMIYIERGDETLRNIIGIPKEQKYAKLNDFFDNETGYKLQKYIEKAQKKRIKGKFDNDVINVSGRVNLLYNTLNYINLRLFPIPDDKTNKWVSWIEIDKYQFDKEDKNFAKNAMVLWVKEIFTAKKTGDYKLADDILAGIDMYQKRFGKAVYPAENKIKWEIFYNKNDPFRSLFWQFMMISLFIFAFAIAQIFIPKKWMNYPIYILYGISILLLLWMTFALGLRWYISGHAPWSNAYESMIYVSFATILFGLILGRKSPLTLAGTLFVASFTLMIAHWNWMDPQIENLVPVLNSFWLDIHVAVIVASYGPFTLGLVLGLLSLILMIFVNTNNKERIESYIKELTYITEMALIIGLIMLTIGNFLGGQWANESWGRYWGWDPKETWALISIVVYAIVIHARFVPGLRGLFAFNLLSVVSFASIAMTYFGVNYYLSGLHSYAKGEPQATPVFIYYFIAFVVFVSAFAYYKHQKYLKK